MPAALRIPERVAWAVALLDARPAEHLLEIGCGPGHAVALLCARPGRGTVSAIDRSAAMVARARERNAGCVAAGRARIEQQTLADASLGRRFDRILAVNVNAFWTAPAPSVAALARLLRPGGACHLVYEPPSAARARELRRTLPDELAAHGFHTLDVVERPFRASRGLCIIGRPAGAGTAPTPGTPARGPRGR
jgi:SAM-dependent methyltransferase